MQERNAGLWAVTIALVLTGRANAWYPPTDTVGPLTVTIGELGEVTALETPIPVVVTLTNKGKAPLAGKLRLSVIDNWRIVGENPVTFRVGPEKSQEMRFTAVAGRGTYAAHYPIHAFAEFQLDGRLGQAHAVLVCTVSSVTVASRTAKSTGLQHAVALRAEEPIEVDGDLREWSNAIPIPFGERQCSLGKVGPGDLEGVLMVLHDTRYLYIGLRITDDNISAEDTTSRDYVDSDYVRLYLGSPSPRDRRSATLTEEDLVLAINPFGASKPLIKMPSYGFKTRAIADLNQVAAAARRTAAGYDLEIAVPFDLIGPSLVEGKSLGFNLMLGDADQGHREGEITIGGQEGEYWTSPNCYMSLELSSRTKDDGQITLPVSAISGRGVTPLDRLAGHRVQISRKEKPIVAKPLGWAGQDQESGAVFSPDFASRPDRKPCIGIHPPYRNGVGPLWADARFALPDTKPITVTFFTAIRDNTEKEPPSDGVEWRVLIAPEGGEFKEVFQRFSKAKAWEKAEADLSAYAGRTVTLRLWNGPGPDNNTLCDSGYWGEPTLIVGAPPKVESLNEIGVRRQQALRKAAAARSGQIEGLSWRLQSRAGVFGVGLELGPRGLVDGALAFGGDAGEVVFEGFDIEVAGEGLADWRSKATVTKVEALRKGSQTTIRHQVHTEGKTIAVDTTFTASGGGLNISFRMPEVARDKRGEPRFTRMGIGPASVAARRVYAGFGNVIQNPGRYALWASGFQLSTRHVGIDFDNHLSLLQASDIQPDRFEVDPDKRLYSLQTHHDATLTFVPSAKGAFAAARVYRDHSGFKPAGGVEKLKGRMCIDWWGHHNIAGDIRRAAAYGLNDSVFIKHAWQRWGYDYRLPDIYPPACDPTVWNDWVSACKEAGMLCAVHDNYIDFYPDAEGFTYKHIVFNADGTPQRAWYNPGPNAQSYRWLPHAFKPWLVRNLQLIKQGFAPTAYFIDVFSAIPLIDYYDEEGRFYTKADCAKAWGECFDYVREALGNNAPQISEAGHDGLVGHLDGCQSDHSSAKAWGWKCSDSERIPWHDMATHGSLILLAGGLGPRYSGGEPYADWASDDYLSNTVMGGRNPMCTGPCTRATVMTYWLLHDICNELAHQSFETHEFVGDDIHRQHTTFGRGGEVWCNRGVKPWKVGGTVLPKHGFLARSRNVMASIAERDGLSVGFAQSPGVTFVDARPESLDLAERAPVRTRVLSAQHLGNGQIECEVEWEVLKPIPKGYVIFVHVCHDAMAQSEKIALHPSMDLPLEKLQEVGLHRCKTRFAIPATLWEGEYRLRYGLYTPTGGGGRLAPIAYLDGSRVRGGIFTVKKKDEAIEWVTYTPEVPGPDAPRQNFEAKRIDFGPVVTNGAFRLLQSGNLWKLLPLQGSLPFKAELKLDKLGAAGKRVISVGGCDQSGTKVSTERFEQTADRVQLDLSAEAFLYTLVLR